MMIMIMILWYYGTMIMIMILWYYDDYDYDYDDYDVSKTKAFDRRATAPLEPHIWKQQA